jgi:hypothetical protein
LRGAIAPLIFGADAFSAHDADDEERLA